MQRSLCKEKFSTEIESNFRKEKISMYVLFTKDHVISEDIDTDSKQSIAVAKFRFTTAADNTPALVAKPRRT